MFGRFSTSLNGGKLFPTARLIFAGLACAGATVWAQVYVPIDLGAVVNEPWTDITAGSTYPKGAQVYGSVPFNIADNGAGQNFWGSLGSANGSLTVPINVFGADRIYFLMNTAWGIGGANTASLTFTGSGGATYTATLVGGIDIRDHFNSGYTNSLGGSIATNVWSNGSGARLDQQLIVLPTAFSSQFLTQITVSDLIFSAGNSSLILGGITAQAVPEPGTLTLIALGLLGILGTGGRAVRSKKS